MSTEDERAVAYREACKTRHEARVEQWTQLAGDDEAAAAVYEDWQPIICWLAERRTRGETSNGRTSTVS